MGRRPDGYWRLPGIGRGTRVIALEVELSHQGHSKYEGIAYRMDLSKSPSAQLLFDNLDLLTVEDLARTLGRAPKTVRNWVARREIPFVAIGRKTYFRRRSIEAWLDRKEFKSWL